ncbi:DUF2214 family protein [Arsenicitalea aurantiaca]|uniref:DUF2214 family protein n=2 Tax=Arsenicitalea aurantiaca TaxID=1783274 RepID=A0A433X8P9_9HYPH|nr:DUF2214 family protein [Arsenicitalea aurantiaca]
MLDLVLAIAHHLAVFALVGLIFAEFVILRPGLEPRRLGQLSALDAAYGLSAVAVLVAGVARVVWGAKGAEYYLSSHAFWGKMGALVIIGILSIPPTLAIMKWKKAAKADPAYVVPEAEIGRMRLFLHIELFLLFLVPIFAAMMARRGLY